MINFQRGKLSRFCYRIEERYIFLSPFNLLPIFIELKREKMQKEKKTLSCNNCNR